MAQSLLRLDPAPRPGRLYAGADQPARRPLMIATVDVRGTEMPVATRDVTAAPFHVLTEVARTDAPDLPPMLVVPPLSGHMPVLMRDVVAALAADFRVRMIDWVNPRHVPVGHGRFGLDDNVTAIERALRLTGPGTSVLALCQSGLPALAATARMAAREEAAQPSALVLMGAPVDPLAAPTPIVSAIRSQPVAALAARTLARVPVWFEGRTRRVYPAAMQMAALTLYMTRRLTGRTEISRKLVEDDGADPVRFPFLDLYSSVMDLDAEHFLQNIAAVFHDRSIVRGRLACCGEMVEPSAIARTALMTVEGAGDDIAAPGQTSAAHALCPAVPDARRARLVVEGAGHFSLFHGRIWRTRVMPEVREFCQRAA